MCVLQCVSYTTSTSNVKHMTLQLQQTRRGCAMVEGEMVHSDSLRSWSTWVPINFLLYFSFYIPQLCSSRAWYSAVMLPSPKYFFVCPKSVPYSRTWDRRLQNLLFHRMSHYRLSEVNGLTCNSFMSYLCLLRVFLCLFQVSRMNLLETETYADVLTNGRRRKRPKLAGDVNDLSSLLAKAEVGISYQHV